MREERLGRINAALGEDAVGRLVALSIAAERESILEDMLNKSLANYLLSRAGGNELYGEDARVGKVFISKFNNIYPYMADIGFSPKGMIQQRLRCVQMVMGVIDYQDKTYSFAPCCDELPTRLVEDVEGAMQMFGLKKSVKPY